MSLTEGWVYLTPLLLRFMNQKNKVNIIGYYGSDKHVALSAWQSTAEELNVELPEDINSRVDFIFQEVQKTKKRDYSELIKGLARDGHSTPFEKVELHFQIKGDIASHIHSLKHRLSEINGESARYKELLSDSFYVPEDWKDIPADVSWDNKNSIGVWLEGLEFSDYNWSDILDFYNQLGNQLYHQAMEQLTPKLGRKRAKESARYFKTYSSQLNYDWKMNFRSFVNIQNLRNDSHAQVEIHQITNTMLYLVENIPGNPLKYSLEAYNLKSDENFIIK